MQRLRPAIRIARTQAPLGPNLIMTEAGKNAASARRRTWAWIDASLHVLFLIVVLIIVWRS